MSAMHLRLSLPPHTDPPGTGVETRPAELERWLKGLPLLNVAESTQLLTRHLRALNRTSLDDKLRLRLMEILRAPILHVSQALIKSYSSLPLPLSDKARQVATQVRELQTEMGFGYKLIAFNSTAVAKLDASARTLVGVAIHRALRYLTDLLFHSYELYTQPPEGTWFEIHQLYRYAELLGITDTSFDDKLNSALPQVSIGHAYKQALLLDFSDPYHLPLRMLAKIYRYLDRWAVAAHLSPGVAELKSHCQFLINLDQDRAGAVNTETAPITTEVRYRLLNTGDLARIIHQQLLLIQSGQQPQADGLEPDFYAHFAQDMLVRLINAWGVNPKRGFSRSPRTDRQTRTIIGIDAINYFVNGEYFSPSSNEVGPQPRGSALGPGGTSVKRSMHLTDTPTSSLWELTDESAGGYALAKSGATAESVRVGDLLGNRNDSGNGGLEIGIVRWVRTTGIDNIEIGVQRVAPSVQAVAVILPEDNQERYSLALGLPEVRAMKQPATLITQRGLHKVGRILFLDDGFRLRKIKLSTLLELSGSFERFHYQFIDA